MKNKFINDNIKPVESTDLSKVMIILKEYTQKLQEECEKRESLRIKNKMFFLAGGMVVFILVFGYASIYSNNFSFANNINSLSYITVLVAMCMFFVLGVPSLLFDKSNRFFYEAHHVAYVIEKIIRFASQYQEHAQNKVIEKFEFEIRLAEAEATLRTYYKIFKDNNNIKYNGYDDFDIKKL